MRIDPARDWFTLLAVSGIALAGIIIWDLQMPGSSAGGDAAGAPAAGEPAEFNLSSVRTVQDIFSNRASEETKYRTGKYRFTDPSQ